MTLPPIEELFPYRYLGGGYYRKNGVPVKVTAPTLHGQEAIQFLYDAIKNHLEKAEPDAPKT